MSLIYILNKKDVVKYDDDYDDVVIISPSLYWFKECQIPTKNKTKAKKIASHMITERPSHFDEVFVCHVSSGCHAYAYDKVAVDAIIEKLNLKEFKTYFANQILFKDALRLDAKTILQRFNESVVEFKNTTQNDLPSLRSEYPSLLSSVKPMMQNQSDDKQINRYLQVSAVMLVCYIALFSFDKLSKLNELDKKLENASSISGYKMEALAKRYKKIQKNKEKIAKELETVLAQNKKVKKITFKNSRIKVD